MAIQRKNQHNNNTQQPVNVDPNIEITSDKEESIFKDILEEEIKIEERFNSAGQFLHNNQKIVWGVLGGLLALVAIVVGYKNIYLPKQEKAAQDEMFYAQMMFEKDSFKVALDGNGNYPGFLDIISNYSSGTKAHNLAHYYAGVSYLNLGEFENAIEHLSDFKGTDQVLGAMALGATGDAYLELNDQSNALSYYKKAANYSSNEITSIIYLLRAGNLMEEQKDFKGAKSYYETIKQKFPQSAQARDIDRYIARAEANL